ncbi:hypothetical protein [Paenibacillus macerans]|uniref:hypothetical protein n=1 Tax=Paenibacillus macerans TaxID=44252 RepID=UPI003D320F1C
MNSLKTLYQVTGELQKDQLHFKITPWKLLIETNRYYEIKPMHGSVKRLYKEKLNMAIHETKSYADGILMVSAFCREEHIEEIQTILIDQLASKINNYLKDLELNQKALHFRLGCQESGSYT